LTIIRKKLGTFAVDSGSVQFQYTSEQTIHKGQKGGKPVPASNDLTTSSVKSACSLIWLQVLSWLATFTFKQLLLRLASPKVFGTAAIQLDHFYSPLSYFSLVKMFEMRFSRTSPKYSNSVKVQNISTILVLLGTQLAFSLTFGYHIIVSPSTQGQPEFNQAVFIYAFAALLDLVSEPLHNRAHRLLLQ
jgi:oligosaccharide translocation protein RFT1